MMRKGVKRFLIVFVFLAAASPVILGGFNQVKSIDYYWADTPLSVGGVIVADLAQSSNNYINKFQSNWTGNLADWSTYCGYVNTRIAMQQVLLDTEGLPTYNVTADDFPYQYPAFISYFDEYEGGLHYVRYFVVQVNATAIRVRYFRGDPVASVTLVSDKLWLRNDSQSVQYIEFCMHVGIGRIDSTTPTLIKFWGGYSFRIGNNVTTYMDTIGGAWGYAGNNLRNEFYIKRGSSTAVGSKCFVREFRMLRHIYASPAELTDYPFNAAYFIKDYIYIDSPPPVTPTPFIGEYWNYTSFRLINDANTTVVVATYNSTGLNNSAYNYTWNSLAGQAYTVPFYYNSSAINPNTWGDWSALWNWLRDGLCAIVNGLILTGQFILYLLVVAFNYLIMWILIVVVIPFGWNIPIYWIWFGINALGYWLMIVGLMFIWGLLWLWNTILLPLLQWVIQVGIPALLMGLLIVAKYLLATVLYIATFGTQDFTYILTQVSYFIDNLLTYINSMFGSFFTNIPAILAVATNIFMVYAWDWIKIFYAGSMGYPNRKYQLEQQKDALELPFKTVWHMIQSTKETLTGYI